MTQRIIVAAKGSIQMQIVINRLCYAPMRSHSSFDSEKVLLNQAKRHRGFLPTPGRRESGEQGEDETELVPGLSVRGAEKRCGLMLKCLNVSHGEQEGQFSLCVGGVSADTPKTKAGTRLWGVLESLLRYGFHIDRCQFGFRSKTFWPGGHRRNRLSPDYSLKLSGKVSPQRNT